MRNDGLSRVNFYDRQFLRPRDLIDEQLYHLIGHRRHNVGPHSWGIVGGLWLTKQEGSVYVETGMAIDGYGRDLVLGQRRLVRTQAFDERGTESLHVWLLYDESSAEGAPPGYAGCIEPNGNDRSDIDGAAPLSHYRWREEPAIVLTDGNNALAPRGAPDGVPAVDLDFAPHRPFPTEEEPWGVYLGTILREEPGAAAPYSFATDERPYVDLVGWQINHPAGTARIDLGSEDGGERKFAVFIDESSVAEPLPAGVPRIEIEQIVTPGPPDTIETTVTFRGDAVVEGNVAVETGTVGFDVAPDYDDAQRRWQLYLTHDPDTTNDELRLEIGDTQPTGRNRLAVGKWDATKGRFEPCLTVTDECVITVHGNLVVEGELQEEAAVAAQHNLVQQVVREMPRLFPELVEGVLKAYRDRDQITDVRPAAPMTLTSAAGPVAVESAVSAIRELCDRVVTLEQLAESIAALDDGIAERLRRHLVPVAGEQQPPPDDVE